MEVANLVRHLRIHGKALTVEEINRNFAEFRRHVEEGIVFSGVFHFNAGPYISFVEVTWTVKACCPGPGKMKYPSPDRNIKSSR